MSYHKSENKTTSAIISFVLLVGICLAERACAPGPETAISVIENDKQVKDITVRESHYWFVNFYGCGAGDSASHKIYYKEIIPSFINGEFTGKYTYKQKEVIVCCGVFTKNSCTIGYNPNQ